MGTEMKRGVYEQGRKNLQTAASLQQRRGRSTRQSAPKSPLGDSLRFKVIAAA
jgi:hypothetical protein